MKHVNKYLGTIGLLSFLLVGIATTSAFAAGNTKPTRKVPAPAASKMTKTAAAPKAKTAKKKRHHTRRSTRKSTKKS